MSLPVYKIEVWEPGGGSALHTITDKVPSLYFKDVLTDGVGHFNFVIPTKKNGSDYYYNDIDLYDTVKIWLAYDSVPANPNFVGKIYKISAPLNAGSGYVRQISGLDQGEILLRKLIAAKAWMGTGASTIVTEVANDLGLGAGSIEADATAVTLFGVNETYFDILTKVSDYWFSAVSQIKKDFHVDINNNLVWASRDGTAPFRSSTNVETFTVGDNILAYQVTQNLQDVKNKIITYGKFDSTAEMPNDETWTESLTNWTANIGTLSLENVLVKAGTYSIKCLVGADNGGFQSDFERTFLPEWAFTSFREQSKENSFGGVHFWIYSTVAPVTITVEFQAPDSANYYYAPCTWVGAGWLEKTVPFSTMSSFGSPNIDALTKIRIRHTGSVAVGYYILLDDFAFTGGRFYATVEDSTSQTNYGVRELRHISDQLKSDSDCESRGQALTYQKKDSPIQLEITAEGNGNVLIGDRLSQTIPAEDISAVDFDVISVEQALSNEGWRTKFTAMNTPNIRSPIPQSLTANIISLKKMMRDLNREMYTMK